MKSWQNNIAIHKKLENIKPTKMHNLVNKVIYRGTSNFHITQNIDGLHRDKAKEKILSNCMAVFSKPNVFTVERNMIL